jgi:hypothetical protein
VPLNNTTGSVAQAGLQAPVIGFDGLFAYCSVTWHAAGINSSITRGYAGARSVVTLVEHGPCTRARMKNRRVAARSRFGDTSTSMTWPSWSIARYRHPPTSDFHIRLIHEPTITGGADTDPGWGRWALLRRRQPTAGTQIQHRDPRRPDGDHAGGALVPAVRALVPRRGGAAGRTGIPVSGQAGLMRRRSAPCTPLFHDLGITTSRVAAA